MGQQEIFDFLKVQWLNGNKQFWSSTEIFREMAKAGQIKTCKRVFDKSIQRCYASGYLEVQWRYVGMRGFGSYRIKESVLDFTKVKNPLDSSLTMQEYRQLT